MKRFAFLLFLIALSAQGATDGSLYSQKFVVKESKANGTASVTIQKPSLGSSYTLTLPDDDGTSNQVLRTDGSGVLSWGSAAVAPGTAGPVYSDGTSLASTAFAGNGNKVVGVNSGGTAQELKSFAVGTSGTDFAVANGVGAITYNLPDAGASARGVVTTGSQTLAGAKTFSSGITVDQAAPGTAISAKEASTELFSVTTSGSVAAVSVGKSSGGFGNDAEIDLYGGGDGPTISLRTMTTTGGFDPNLNFSRSRASGATRTIVTSGDDLGKIDWQGYDGSAETPAARILGEVDGTPGAGDMPGRLSFWTTADGASTPTERLRITNAGDFQVTGADPFIGNITADASDTARLSVSGGGGLGQSRGGTMRLFGNENGVVPGGIEFDAGVTADTSAESAFSIYCTASTTLCFNIFGNGWMEYGTRNTTADVYHQFNVDNDSGNYGNLVSTTGHRSGFASGGSSGVQAFVQSTAASSGNYLMSFTNNAATNGDQIFFVAENDNSAYGTTTRKGWSWQHNGTENMYMTRGGELHMTGNGVAGTDGNIPFECNRVTTSPATVSTATASCAANEIAMGGGCGTGGTNALLTANLLTASFSCVWSASNVTSSASVRCCSY